MTMYKYPDSNTFVPMSEGELFPNKCPKCGVGNLKDNGGCSEGCCDDYKCEACGYTFRVECPD